MAQAARLSLRLQKELKLLLADPPPGASFPSLSSSSSSSLSSIDALIQGPEGSVYANGFFKLKIDIPDRYPFQPPIVTFATPVYHPNIDNGGRICLDILNLPPKGAWQPSLNISTVLTSIGLLLSEPNPDDGLMHEASKEYKYNRQAFDQKARSMTEKFARPMASDNANGDEVNQTLPSASSTSSEVKDMDVPQFEVNKGFANNKGIWGANGKKSLELSGLNHKRNRSNEVDEQSVSHFAHNQMDTGGFEQISKEYETDYGGQQQNSKEKLIDLHQNHDKLQKTEQKSSSLKLLGPLEERSNEDILVPKDCSALLESENISRGSNKMFTASEQSSILSCSSVLNQTASSTQISSHIETQTHNGPVDRNSDGFVLRRQKKLGLAGRRPYLGLVGSLQSQLQDNKENLISDPPSNHSVTFSMPSVMPESGEKENTCTTNIFRKKIGGITPKQPLTPLIELQHDDDNAKRNKQFESQAISKSNPLNLSYNPRPDEKLHHKEDHDDNLTDKIEQQEGSPISENIVVLDSEDSEDEKEVSHRFKFSLARKRLMQKQKARV